MGAKMTLSQRHCPARVSAGSIRGFGFGNHILLRTGCRYVNAQYEFWGLIAWDGLALNSLSKDVFRAADK
jgi:hypothetical protein